MYNPVFNTIMLRFSPDTEPQVILDLAEVMTLYHSAVISFLFALRGAHDNGGQNKVLELAELIDQWVQMQIRILEVGEP